MKRALISVYNKTGIVEFTRTLIAQQFEIVSTGGTAKHLSTAGIPIKPISELTGLPEILDGRVKTLHPKIFGGILARRDDESHLSEIEQHHIALFDMVVINLYPFEETIRSAECTESEALDNIDIGGPSMIRAAAKNYPHVAVLTQPEQYPEVANEMKNNQGEVSLATRKRLAAKAFSRTCEYDAAISGYFTRDSEIAQFPQQLALRFKKIQDLRYGENPHQKAAVYGDADKPPAGIIAARQLHGKALSFNNYLDLDAAVGCVQEFREPCAAIIKHTNPCGLAVGSALAGAYARAKATDPVSAFGSVVGLNKAVDEATARAISEIFTEVVVAPAFEPAALKILQTKKNIRLLECLAAAGHRAAGLDVKRVQGGVLIQDQDFFNLNDIKFTVITKRQPTDYEWQAMKLGWRIVKWVKSNAIVFTSNTATIGIGAGQMSRVDSTRLAVEKARQMGLDLTGTGVASDAFYPFSDGVEMAARAGATAIIQPGGSIRDPEVVETADQLNLAMVFTHVRHFRH
ncbi:MAG: bifunctional phosphoribosylaminoimidazolecarboxamide formyltransferase/IMP cyclohydrolase [bacterium]